jgi:hypothetical protein
MGITLQISQHLCRIWGLLGCKALQFGEPGVSEEHNTSIFKVEEYVKQENQLNLPPAFAGLLDYSSSLKMEAILSRVGGFTWR